jgi:hypothetical protein
LLLLEFRTCKCNFCQFRRHVPQNKANDRLRNPILLRRAHEPSLRECVLGSFDHQGPQNLERLLLSEFPPCKCNFSQFRRWTPQNKPSDRLWNPILLRRANKPSLRKCVLESIDHQGAQNL